MEERGALFDDGAKASIDAARKVHRAIWRIMIKRWNAIIRIYLSSDLRKIDVIDFDSRKMEDRNGEVIK